MRNPQKENGYTGIANELLQEIMVRNFSKRQLNILLFLLRLTYGNSQKYTYIEHLNAFELCGLDKSDIKFELNYLIDAKVIEWDHKNIFGLNKKYEFWQINRIKKYTTKKWNSILHDSLQNTNKSVGKISTHTEESKTESLQNTNLEVCKIPTSKFVKHQQNEAEKIDSEQVTEPPKESIKESIKENNTNNSSFSSQDENCCAEEKEFLKFSSVLAGVKGYKFNESIDKAVFSSLKEFNPDKNIIEAVASFCACNNYTVSGMNYRPALLKYVKMYNSADKKPVKIEKVRGEVNDYIPPDPANRGSPLDFNREESLAFIQGFKKFPKYKHPVIINELIEKWDFTDEELIYGAND